MRRPMTIPGFTGETLHPGDTTFDAHREVWNAMVDRRPALIARCTGAQDVAAAIRHARQHGLEIGVKCGGHSVLGLSVPHDLSVVGSDDIAECPGFGIVEVDDRLAR